MSEQEKKPTSMADLDHLLKEVYLDKLSEQLGRELIFYGNLDFPEHKETFRDKWHNFWSYIPDFIGFIKSYEYYVWRYKE